MPDSPSAWLRSLAAEATPGPWLTGPWSDEHPEHVCVYSGDGRTIASSDGGEVAREVANIRLIALAPDLAVLCADAIDALEYVLGYDVAGWDAHMDSPHLLNPKLRDLLARFAALQPENTDEAASEDPTAGLPADLVSALRDPNVVVPQDAALFDLLAKWKNAPSDTASAETPEGEGR